MTVVRDAFQSLSLPTAPRDRVWRTGTHTIGDGELLALLLGPGPRDHRAVISALEIVRSAGGLATLSRSSPRELAQIAGVGSARATRIAAAFELGRRAVELVRERPTMTSPADVHARIAPRLAGLAQEVFLVIGVDVRNGMLDIVECNRGHVSGVEVHPREVFRPLVRMAAAGGVLVHNHPSGDPTPSAEDVELTKRLRDVGQILGIPIIDHVVIGGSSYRSIAEWVGA